MSTTRAKDKILATVVASTYMNSRLPMSRTAGEVRFIKDQGPPEVGRRFTEDYTFNPKSKKPMTKVLWSLSCALGHLVSAYGTFTKIKSVSVSPDGKLGGKGYIQEIKEMRKQLNESIETISGLQDTLNDEVRAPHWVAIKNELPTKEREEVEEMLSDADDISNSPEGYDDDEYEREVLDDIEDSE